MLKPAVDVSIVTVSFRDAEGLRATAASLRGQSVEAEWIICDGGSDPDTLRLLKQLPPSVMWSSESDDGIYDAMRKGLKRCTGRFVLFLNSGDIFAGPSALATAASVASSQPEYDVFFFSSVFCFSSSQEVIRVARNPRSYIYHSVPGNQQSTLYSRKALQSLEFPVQYEICGDYALASMLHANKYRMKNENLTLGRFMMGGRSTFKLVALCREAWDIQKRILRMGFFARSASLALRILTTGRTLLRYSLARRSV